MLNGWSLPEDESYDNYVPFSVPTVIDTAVVTAATVIAVSASCLGKGHHVPGHYRSSLYTRGDRE
ncbi:hypothetical protein BDF21DRAFT_458697 [Thamnidium elegans]|nr:hypothetical protein BDF21DRAFT_458697 [Thamnidium elegans]